MARSHGRILSSIWMDADFLACSARAQRLYLFLLSQPDLSHAGLLPLRERRWASKVTDLDATNIAEDLCELRDARFILFDRDTEELLIRTFVRNDGIYKQPKVMIRLREDASEMESPELRAAFIAEIRRLPLDELSDAPGGPNRDQPSTREAVAKAIKGIEEDFGTAPEYPIERVSDTPTDTPRVRTRGFPQPPSPIPSPHPPTDVPATPGSALAPLDAAAPTAQTLIGEWIDHSRERPAQRVIGQAAKEVKQLLDEGMTYERVRQGLAEWAAKGQHPTTIPSFVSAVGNRRTTSSKQAETDGIFERAAARMAAREATT